MAHRVSRAIAGGCGLLRLGLVALPLGAALTAWAQSGPSPSPGDAVVATLDAAAARAAGESGTLQPSDAEPALRQAALQALWPADIARLCGDYLDRYPRLAWSGEALRLQRQALHTAELLRRADVQLFRAAFDALRDDAAAAADLRLAALGDAAAAWRLAARAQTRDDRPHRRVGWLQYAAMLGSDRAAYELALHYRRASQPLLAARYESRALELGFSPPPALDHRRP